MSSGSEQVRMGAHAPDGPFGFSGVSVLIVILLQLAVLGQQPGGQVDDLVKTISGKSVTVNSSI